MRSSLSRIRWVGLLALLVLACAGLAACGGDSDGSSTSGGTESTSSEGGSGGEFTVGVVGSQTGFLAPYEEPLLNAMKLSAEELNAAGGLEGEQVKLVIKDGKSEPAEGAIAAQEVLADDPGLLVVPCDQDVALPAARLGQEAGVPTISSCAGAATFPGIVGDDMFLNTPGTFAEGSALAQFAKKKGWKTAYVLTTKDAAVFSTSSEAFEAQFEEEGGTIVGAGNYSLGQPKYTPQTEAVAKQNPKPDVLMLSTNTPETTVMLKELASQGVELPIVTVFGNQTNLLFQAGSALDQMPMYIATIGVIEPGNKMEAFYKKYQAKYGEFPDTTFAAFGADIINLLDVAVKAAGSTEPEAIRDAIANTVDAELTTGPATYKGQNGVPKKGFYIVTPAAKDTFEIVDQFFPTKVFAGN